MTSAINVTTITTVRRAVGNVEDIDADAVDITREIYPIRVVSAIDVRRANPSVICLAVGIFDIPTVIVDDTIRVHTNYKVEVSNVRRVSVGITHIVFPWV